MIARLTGPTDFPKYSYIKQVGYRISPLVCGKRRKHLERRERRSTTERHSSPGRRGLTKFNSPEVQGPSKSTSKRAVSVSKVRIVLLLWVFDTTIGLPVLG